MRAGGIQDSLANLDEFERGARERVLSQVPPASRVVLETTLRPCWVSIEHDHFTVEAIVSLFGKERAIEYWRRSFVRLLDRPLLRTFASGMINVMGRDPATVIGFFVRGWGLAYRDMCEPRYELRDGRPAIVFADVPPAVRPYLPYFHSWEGTVRGFAHIARVEGNVDFRIAPDRSSAVALFRWR